MERNNYMPLASLFAALRGNLTSLALYSNKMLKRHNFSEDAFEDIKGFCSLRHLYLLMFDYEDEIKNLPRRILKQLDSLTIGQLKLSQLDYFITGRIQLKQGSICRLWLDNSFHIRLFEDYSSLRNCFHLSSHTTHLRALIDPLEKEKFKQIGRVFPNLRYLNLHITSCHVS